MVVTSEAIGHYSREKNRIYYVLISPVAGVKEAYDVPMEQKIKVGDDGGLSSVA